MDNQTIHFAQFLHDYFYKTGEGWNLEVPAIRGRMFTTEYLAGFFEWTKENYNYNEELDRWVRKLDASPYLLDELLNFYKK